MKNIALTFFIFISCLGVFGQRNSDKSGQKESANRFSGETKVFITKEDFVNGGGIPMEEKYISWGGGIKLGEGRNDFVKFKTMEGERAKFKFKEIWGFLYKGQFFRVVGKELAMLSSMGSLQFWVNGSSGLIIVSDDNGKGGIVLNTGETACFLSVDGITEKIYRLPKAGSMKRDLEDLKKEHTELESLYDCFELSWNLVKTFESIENCVSQYNSKHSMN